MVRRGAFAKQAAAKAASQLDAAEASGDEQAKEEAEVEKKIADAAVKALNKEKAEENPLVAATGAVEKRQKALQAATVQQRKAQGKVDHLGRYLTISPSVRPILQKYTTFIFLYV